MENLMESMVILQEQYVVAVCSPEDLIVYKLISTRARDHVRGKDTLTVPGDGRELLIPFQAG